MYSDSDVGNGLAWRSHRVRHKPTTSFVITRDDGSPWAPSTTDDAQPQAPISGTAINMPDLGLLLSS